MASSPYIGTARKTEGGSGTPGRMANPPGGGDVMNQTKPSQGGGKPPVAKSRFAADTFTPGVGSSDHDADDDQS